VKFFKLSSLQTSSTIQWCLHSIVKDRELYNRIKLYVKDNPADMEPSLVRASLRETLRMYPVAPFISRILADDAKIGKLTIPKGWLVLLSMYTSGRDPDNFSEPSLFVPDRWLRQENETAHKVFNAHGTMPFAMGSRSCVGRKIASYQIHCLVTKVTNANNPHHLYKPS